MKKSLVIVLGVAVLALMGLALLTPSVALADSLTPSPNGEEPVMAPMAAPVVAPIVASAPLPSFADVTADTWCHDAVIYAAGIGIMKGIDATTFAPDAALTRAMLVTVLHRLDGQPEPTGNTPFSDLAAGVYYAKAAVWAAEKGLLAWSTANTFRPSDPVAREELIVALYRYAVLKGYDVSVGENTNILSYADAFDISEGRASAFQWACGAGVVRGNGPNLSPLGTASRGQAATMLMRFLANVAK